MEERFDTSGYVPTTARSHRPLPIGKNKKVIGLMKDELGGTIMTEFMSLRPKLCSYKKLDGSETSNEPHFVEDKKCKGIKKCIGKKTLTGLRIIRIASSKILQRMVDAKWPQTLPWIRGSKTKLVAPNLKSRSQDERTKRAKVCGTSGSARQGFTSAPVKLD